MSINDIACRAKNKDYKSFCVLAVRPSVCLFAINVTQDTYIIELFKILQYTCWLLKQSQTCCILLGGRARYAQSEKGRES